MYNRIIATLALLSVSAATPTVTSAQSLTVPGSHMSAMLPASAARLTGVYQISITSATTTIPARLIVEHTHAGLNVLILTDNGSVSALRDVTVEGETLHALVLTDNGPMHLDLRIAAEGVSGTMGANKATWAIMGTKTA